jgi:hypothetical protein
MEDMGDSTPARNAARGARIRAALDAAGGPRFYIEDESTKPWEQIPESLRYLSSLEL